MSSATPPVIDVVALDWIEIRHPFTGATGDSQTALEVPSQGAHLPAGLPPHSRLFAPNGRLELAPSREGEGSRLADPGKWFLVQGSAYLKPSWVRRARPSSLRAANRQADYLMIGHRSLLQGIGRLAEHHRQRGVSVEIVDVETVYDDFAHGIETPEAIRAFVAHTQRAWRKPAPRFVLLVGDASWSRREAIPEGDPSPTRAMHRNLVPTWTLATNGNLAASDNPFVTVAGDDWKPDLAIGRLPAATPEELEPMVDKILNYSTEPELGPWRREILWITSADPKLRGTSNELAAKFRNLGFAPRLIDSPEPPATDPLHQERVRHALNQGALIVHFLGHGGRFVWRTAPPDLADSTDLFTTRDVVRLAPSRRLPFILSMTCTSAPFDHPTADSLGERFVGVSGRGAIGLLGASWRVPASRHFSDALLTELIRPGATVGEAILRAKEREPNKALVESYNLLGDPALTLALPIPER